MMTMKNFRRSTGASLFTWRRIPSNQNSRERHGLLESHGRSVHQQHFSVTEASTTRHGVAGEGTNFLMDRETELEKKIKWKRKQILKPEFQPSTF